MPAWNAAILPAVDKRTAAQKETIKKLIGDCKTFGARTENHFKALAKESPKKGDTGDQAATKGDVARLERKIDQLYDMIAENSKRSFKGAR